MRPSLVTSARAARPPDAVPGSIDVTQIFGSIPVDDLVASGYDDFAVLVDNANRGYSRNHPQLFSPIPATENANLITGAGGFLTFSWSPSTYAWRIDGDVPESSDTSSANLARAEPTADGGRIFWLLPATAVPTHYQLHIAPFYSGGVPGPDLMHVKFSLLDGSAPDFEEDVPLINGVLAYRRYDCLANAGTAGQQMLIEINFPTVDVNLSAFYQAVLLGGTPP